MTILIDNFSIGVAEWVPTSTLSYFSVDVVDLTYGINTSGTYFLHDGLIVPTTYSGVPNGYTFYYTPGGVYSDGTITLTIQAENLNSEITFQNFHFLYGYHCEFGEIINWGPHAEVITTIEASNLAFCPNMEGESFYFETLDLPSVNLGASIKAIESINLGATIYPQNTFFFYGRTYTITISGVKDYGGNEMAPYTFSFTIENSTI